MSLLMQALKKAERAKQNSVADDELDKPSEAFDELLALTPTPAAAAEPAREFNLDGLSLEPMAPPVAAADEPRPSPSPLPSDSDHKQPGQTLDLAPDPAAPPAAAPLAAAEPLTFTPAAASSAAPPAPARAAEAVTAAATATASATPGRASGGARAGGSNNTSNTSNNSTPPAGGAKAAADGAVNADKARSAARARSRAAATATAPAGLDPERLRIYGLVALLVLVVGGLGLYYWRALSGPGAGAELPPIPMPPAGATGATPAQTVSAALAAGAAPAAGDAQAQGADDPMLAPQTGVNRAAQQELERRVAQTEQALQAAVQSMQAATAPRPEQLPPLAAPDNGEIRVARSLQPSPVAPALDSAYQAFNSGDTAGAQQQYEAALAQDPNNRDALLGAAHVAARQNQSDKAAGYYLHLLELSPNDADATAGLVGLRQGDSRQSENRLKAILNNNPDAAPVLFALGNLYAQQSRWPEAQQAYFRAVDAAPDNPDYAYNLAVGLDRLNQPKLAQTYYQRALALAQDKAVGFDRAALRKRLHELNTAGH